MIGFQMSMGSNSRSFIVLSFFRGILFFYLNDPLTISKSSGYNVLIRKTIYSNGR